MKAYKNSDGSLDVLKEKSLFHVKAGRAKYVGQVGPSWRAWGTEVKRIPTNIKTQITAQNEKL